jgi:hypothetical protein
VLFFFGAERGNVVVSAAPSGRSSRTHSVELHVELQALKVRFTEKKLFGATASGLESSTKFSHINL